MNESSPLQSLLAEAAYSAMVETRIRWAGGKYDVSAFAGLTHVLGDSIAILRQQLSSRRYWQRPDASHVGIDPSRQSLTGTSIGINHSKLSGKHWLWNIDLWQESPGLEPNDVGAVGSVDDRGGEAQIRYRENTPRGWYRSWNAGAGTKSEWNFHGDRTSAQVYGFANASFANFWRFSLDASYEPRSMSDALTRGGPLMQTLSNSGARIELQSRSGARNGWGVELGSERDESGGWERTVELSLSYRPGTQWEITLDPSYERELSSNQFVDAIPGGSSSTFGKRYVFANVELSEVAARIRVNYTVTPDLTLETYLEPFASSGRYRHFGELSAARSRVINLYGENGTSIVANADGSRKVSAGATTFNLEPTDFNVRSLRSNAVLRWEWRPGSTLFVVWQQDRSADRAVRRVRPRDIFDTFSAAGDNILALKMSYWIPVR